MTDSSLAERNHLTHKTSGFSSPRRSLGALLKDELALQAVPRGPGASPTNIANFSFAPDGERRLTAWMMDHLEYGFVEVTRDLAALEKAFIAEMQPPLNLTGWKNPQATRIKELRRLCKLEAGQARTRGPSN